MVKNIVLIRHGESEKDKTNPQRGLTSRGKNQIKNASEKIKKIISGSSKIVSTATVRTEQTAQIISGILGVNFETTSINLRVDNFDLIEEEFGKVSDIVFKYFGKFENGKMDSRITSPVEILNRFNKLIKKFKCENLIIVGHSAALECFIEYQDRFIANTNFKKELEYGEFIVLSRNDKLLNI